MNEGFARLTGLMSRSDSVSSLNSAITTPASSVFSTPPSPASSAATIPPDTDGLVKIQNLYVLKSQTDEDHDNLIHSTFIPLIDQELGHHLHSGIYLTEPCYAGFSTRELRPAILITAAKARTKKRIFRYLAAQADLEQELKKHRLVLHVALDSMTQSRGPAEEAQVFPTQSAQLIPSIGSPSLCRSQIRIRGSESTLPSTCTSGLTFWIGDKYCGSTSLHPWMPNYVYGCSSEDDSDDSDEDEDDDGMVLSISPDLVDLSDALDIGSPPSSNSAVELLELNETKELCTSALYSSQDHDARVGDQAETKLHSEHRFGSVQPLYRGNSADWIVYDAQQAAPDLSARELSRNEVDGYQITEFHCEDSYSKIPITVATHEGEIHGSLHPGKVMVRCGFSTYEMRLVTLEQTLRPGCSGAAVTHRNELCGTIQVIRENVPWAYMIPIEFQLKEMEAVCGARIQLPTHELKVESIHTTQFPDIPERWTSSLLKFESEPPTTDPLPFPVLPDTVETSQILDGNSDEDASNEGNENLLRPPSLPGLPSRLRSIPRILLPAVLTPEAPDQADSPVTYAVSYDDELDYCSDQEKVDSESSLSSFWTNYWRTISKQDYSDLGRSLKDCHDSRVRPQQSRPSHLRQSSTSDDLGRHRNRPHSEREFYKCPACRNSKAPKRWKRRGDLAKHLLISHPTHDFDELLQLAMKIPETAAVCETPIPPHVRPPSAGREGPLVSTPVQTTSQPAYTHSPAARSPHSVFRPLRHRVQSVEQVNEYLGRFHYLEAPLKHAKKQPASWNLKCDICSLLFMRQSDHKRHKARHEAPHTCQVIDCPRSVRGFATVNDLNRHEKSVHGNTARNSKTYKCFATNCAKGEKVWPRLDNFKQHLVRMHAELSVEELVQSSINWYEQSVGKRLDSYGEKTASDISIYTMKSQDHLLRLTPEPQPDLSWIGAIMLFSPLTHPGPTDWTPITSQIPVPLSDLGSNLGYLRNAVGYHEKNWQRLHYKRHDHLILTNRDNLSNWLENKSDCLWVRANAGSGKTVLTKYLDEYGRMLLSSTSRIEREALVKHSQATKDFVLDGPDEDGWTPLSWAAATGNLAIFKILLTTSNTDTDSKYEYDRMPLLWAAAAGHDAIIKILLARGNTRTDSKYEYDRMPLLWATTDELAKSILKFILIMNSVNQDSKDECEWAVKGFHEDISILLRRSTNLGMETNEFVRTLLSRLVKIWLRGSRGPVYRVKVSQSFFDSAGDDDARGGADEDSPKRRTIVLCEQHPEAVGRRKCSRCHECEDRNCRTLHVWRAFLDEVGELD